MFKLIQTCIICILISGFCCRDVNAAWPWSGKDKLVTINGIDYSSDDFKRWWGLWNEEKGRLPDDPQPFIEWKLLAQEARTMELDQLGSYRRKLEVFLKSRTRMLLKNEEVDSKIDLPPDKRKAVERKRKQYEKMSPEERERLRKKYSKQKKYR